MEYYSDFNRAPQTTSEAGAELAPVYKFRTQKDGTRKIEKIKDTNVYNKIQEAKSECDIENIIKKYGINLETDMAKFEEEVEDLTGVPTSLNEAHQTLERAQEIFESAPGEIRKTYNQDFGKFVKAVGTGEITRDIENVRRNKGILKGQIEMPETQTKPQTQPQTQTFNRTETFTQSQPTQEKTFTTGVVYE